MTEQITAIELRTTLVNALKELAPIGGTREIPAQTYADALMDLLSNCVFAVGPPSQEEIEWLVSSFRMRLEGATKLAEEMRTKVRH
jgi:hypothetical protein